MTLCLDTAFSFSPLSSTTSASTPIEVGAYSSNTSGRRGFISRAVEATIVATTIGVVEWSTPAAFADVSDGNALPTGAQQFSRLVRLKSDLGGVIKRVTEKADEIDKKEWDNLQEFLRILYKGSDDMKAITKNSIYDPAKKKKAEEDIKLLQKFTQLGDNPVTKQDAPGLADILKKCELILDNFFDLLRDVPDEIWLVDKDGELFVNISVTVMLIVTIGVIAILPISWQHYSP